MKKFLYGIGLSVVFALAAAPFMPGTATATSTSPSASSSSAPAWTPNYKDCATDKGWFVNEDETSRKPEATATGLKFVNNQLIHHKADLKVDDLEPGTYTANVTPNQPSFFSVEVRDASTGAYGTLRWTPGANLWSITIGPDASKPTVTPGTFSGGDPAALLEGKVTKWGAFTSATKVVTFGVGYTNSPGDGVATVVRRVMFQGKTYDLACTKPVQPSASASSKAPSASSSSPAVVPAGQDSLPVTGSKTWWFVGGGVTLLCVGIVLCLVGTRKIRATRPPRFIA